MERYIGVSQARAYLADVLNTAAYASERIVIHRRGQELGAFIGIADLGFLRRHKPRSRFPEPTPAALPSDPLWNELEWRENKLHWEEVAVRKAGNDPTDPEKYSRLVEERAYLDRLRAYLGPAAPDDPPV